MHRAPIVARRCGLAPPLGWDALLPDEWREPQGVCSSANGGNSATTLAKTGTSQRSAVLRITAVISRPRFVALFVVFRVMGEGMASETAQLRELNIRAFNASAHAENALMQQGRRRPAVDGRDTEILDPLSHARWSRGLHDAGPPRTNAAGL